MPERASSVPYNPVPTVESGGGGGTPFSAHANPNDFGAQVSGAVEDAGKTGFDFAMKQQGMINETAMTNADADFATKVGKIKGDYTSLTGMSAYNAFPKYQEDIRQAFQSVRTTLPPAAQRGFDMMATRTMANHIADGSSYASSQLKEANRDSYSSLTNVSLTALLDPDTAMNPERSDYHMDSIKYATQAQLDEDHPGLKKDPETGTVNFDESTPEGKQLKAEFQRRLDMNLSQGYVNKYDTLSKLNPFGAYDQYQQERDKMPKSAQIALDASFAPKIFDAHKQTATTNATVEAQQSHWDRLTNPSESAALDTVQKNEGGMSSDGQSAYGIDKNAHPEEFAKISSLPESERPAEARKFFKEEYYDKKGIAELPENTRNIVMDGVVNHTTDFGDKLIQAAKDGATPQQLIDMRREEYNRVSQIPGKEQYLQGWNNRLDNLQQSTEGKKTYATNENGGPLTLADYYRTHSQEVLARGDAYAERQMPGDLALKRAVRQSLENQMNKVISNESAQHILDNRNVMRGINGELTQGKAPQTEDELRNIPGMAQTLDNIAIRDPKFMESIPTLIAKVARRNDVVNSANGFDTVMRALEPSDSPNRIASEDHLNKLLARKEGTGINMKDYNDAKPVLETSDTWKSYLSKNMKEITNANGNIDGKGQERALTWYNQAMQLKKANDAKGDKAIPEAELMQSLSDSLHPPKPGTMQQISNWVSSLTQKKTVSVISPDGQVGTIPAENLDKAIAAGYKKAG